VWIIKPIRLQDYWTLHRRARPSLEDWLKKAKAARWRNYADARRTFRTADPVVVASGRTITVFDIGGGNYRLITAVHYNTGKLFILRFLTHAEYDKEQWKAEL